ISGPGVIYCSTPDGQITLTAATDAANASFTWSATGGGNIISGQGTSEIVVNAAGNYEVTITDTDNGCSSTCDKDVILDTEAPNCDPGGSYDLNCSNDFTVTLDGSSTIAGVTFQWIDSEGDSLTTDANGDATATEPGLYTLIVTAPNGCSSQ